MAARTPRRVDLIALALLAVVLLGHGAILWWLGEEMRQMASVLRPVSEPLFTRHVLPTPAKVTPVPQPRPKARRMAHAPAKPLPTTLPAPAPAAPPDPVPPEPAATEPAPSAFAGPTLPEPNPEPSPLATALPQPEQWPVNSRASYEVSGNYRGPLYGDARVQWQREGTRYQVQLAIDIGWLASMRMTSQGRIGATQLEPEVYEEITTRKERRHVRMGPDALEFMDKTTRQRPPGVQDAASQFVELAHRFAQSPHALGVGQTVSLWLARPGGVDEWVYDVVAEETVYTPRFGPVQAFHLKPRPLSKPRGPITAEMWFAPSLQYLPVRIRISMSDDVWLDLLLDKLEQ